MGLDVTAYRQLKLEPEARADADGSAPEGMWCPGASMEWSEKQWPGRADGIPDANAYYSYSDADALIRYSYGTHGDFRENLAQLAGFADAKEVWNDPRPGPFVELINFADNEGVIGPAVARKLAADFADNHAEAERRFAKDHPWMWSCYQKWEAACDMAGDGGALEFH